MPLLLLFVIHPADGRRRRGGRPPFFPRREH